MAPANGCNRVFHASEPDCDLGIQESKDDIINMKVNNVKINKIENNNNNNNNNKLHSDESSILPLLDPMKMNLEIKKGNLNILNKLDLFYQSEIDRGNNGININQINTSAISSININESWINSNNIHLININKCDMNINDIIDYNNSNYYRYMYESIDKSWISLK